VGADQPLGRIARRPELLEEARRVLGRNRRGRGVRGRVGGGLRLGWRREVGWGCGRLVQWGGLPASTWGTGR
jgi:hypothetical protein